MAFQYIRNRKSVPESGPLKIGIVAGEPSGDNLGAGLITAICNRFPDTSFTGIGGPNMRSAGCETLYDMDRIELMGIDGLFDKLGDILKIRKALYHKFVDSPPNVFVGVDVPDFNLSLERKLRRSGIRTVHYVSPTVWAWRGYRIRKIRDSVDHMLTLFPFEAEYYRRNDIPVTCVGHPVADGISEPDKYEARKRIGIDVGAGEILVGLLPGSRRSEVGKLAPIMVEAARKLHQRYPQVRFVLPFAGQALRECFSGVATIPDGLPVITLDGQSRDAIEASDIVVLASGTAALEAALYRRPHVVVYKLGTVAYALMQPLRHVDHYSMPNHLLPRPVVPELMQSDATPANIVREVVNYIENPDLVKDLEQQFAQVHKSLQLDANLRASEAVLAMVKH